MPTILGKTAREVPPALTGFFFAKDCMSIYYFDALAGAGKTCALVKHADRCARRGRKVLFLQPTKLLIQATIQGELAKLAPEYRVTAIHGGTTSSVVDDLVAHFQTARDGGELLFATHAAFFRLPWIERRTEWTLIVDEVPQVDIYEEWVLPETHHLITPSLHFVPMGAAYGYLVKAGPTLDGEDL